MGLDQYLYAKKYASNGEWQSEESRKLFASLVELADVSEFIDPDFPSATVEVKVGYWRKQNAIHNWFVKYCQDGTDDCRPSYVNRDLLAGLGNACQAVLDNPSRADELLPTTSGFFFGSTDYDEWYRMGLEYTVATISKLLTMPDEWDFYYQSSW